MKTKRQEQFRTRTCSVQRVRSWATAKILMLLVMLMVGVPGAWAEIKVGKITYYNNYGTAVIAEIDDDAVEIDIPAVVEYHGTKYDVTGFYQTFTLKNHANLKRVSILADDNGECHITQLGNIFSGNTSIEVIELQNSITNLDWCTFEGCTALRRISLPTGITKIPDDMFKGCSSLLSIDIREGVTSIGQAAFYGCSSLENVILPSTLTTLGSYAFNGCSKLRSINIPDGITAIKSGTFKGCSSLATANLPDVLNEIGVDAFSGTVLTSLYIPANLNQENIPIIFRDAAATLTSISVAKGNTLYDSRENCNAIIKKREYQWSKDELVLGCKNTVIPNNVSIVTGAFQNCGFETLTFPKEVKVERDAFGGCNNLKTFIFTGPDPTRYVLPTSYSIVGTSYDGITFIVPHESLEAFRSKFPNYTIESDPSTIRTYYYSDLELYVGSGQTHTLTPLSAMYQSTGEPAFLAYSKSGRMSKAITDVRLVKADREYNLKEQLTIDGKTYHKGKGYGITDGAEPVSTAYYQVYYTTDGCEVAGTPLLTNLEVDDNRENYGYLEPQSDKGYISLVKINDKGQVVERSDNADWNVHGTSDRHTYTYVRATYAPYAVPANEIHYTTTDDTKIEFSSNSVFGSDLIIQSHEFAAGEGTIVFNDVVTGELAAAFAGNDKVSFVMLPKGINSIGNGAFQGCSALAGLMVSNNIHRIGDNAFAGCTSYEKLPLNEWGVTEIGDGAFSGCTSFQNVSIPSAITSISNNLFKGCTNLQRISFDKSLVSIGASAFENCTSLTEMEVPHNVALRTIGARAFYNTGFEIADLQVAAQLTEVGDYAFASCQNLMSLLIGRLERMPAHLFAGSEKAIALFISIFHGTMDDISFDNSEKDKLWRLHIGQAPNMTSIPDRKFKDYTALHVFDFGGLKELTSIGREAFRNTNLDDADMTACDKLATIGEYAFADNPTLDKIELPVALTTINTGTFYGCTNIETINIKGNVVNIGSEAFAGCAKLKTVMLNKGLQTIGSKAFAGSKSDLEVVANLAYEGTYASNTDCFDAAVYSGGTLRKVGENSANANIYGNAPWNLFTNQSSDGSFLMSYENCEFRIYENNFPALDGRMLRGAELVSTTVSNTTYQVEFPSEVNGYPVIAIASGAINMQYPRCHVTIPGSVVSLADNIFSNDVRLESLRFKAGSEPLYVNNPMRYKLNTISVDRDIVCLNGGPFEGLWCRDGGTTLIVGSNCSKLSERFCANSDITRLSISLDSKFTFGRDAFLRCEFTTVSVTASDGYEESSDKYISTLFGPDVYRNAMFSISGSKANEAKSHQPWINFVDDDFSYNGLVLGDDEISIYKIYPRASYNYNIRGDYGAKNLTGAVLIGYQKGTEGLTGDVVIPDRVHGFPVIGIAKGALNDNGNVTSISFPGTLRMIENNAVEKMSELKKVEFRDQLFPRGEKCYIGYSVYDYIDEEAFYKCDALEEVSIGCDLDWCEWKDEPFEDRDNLKTVRITKGCHEIGKDYGDSPYLFNDCEGIKNLIIEDSEDLFYFRENIFSKLSLDYLYLGRTIDDKCLKDDDYSPFYGRRVDKLVVGDCVQYINKWLFKHGTVHIEQLGRNIKSIGYEAFSWADISLSPDCYCPNLEVIGEEAFDYIELLSDFYSFWFDPNNPSESKLRRIEYKGINWQPGDGKDHIFDKVYLPATLEYLGAYSLSSHDNQIRNVYFYPNLHEKTVEIDPNAFEEIYQPHHRDIFKVHTVCANSDKGQCGFPKIEFDGDETSLPFVYDLHVIDSKEGNSLHSDGLYHEVCKACGTDDGRSAKSGNYYIHNWNGTDDIKIHKSGSSYTYAGPLAIDDSKPFQSPVNFSAESVSYNRTVTGGRVVTFVLPFAANALDVNGTVYKFREFSGGKFCFDEQKGTLNANTPYLVVVNEEATQLLSYVSAQSLAATVNNTLSPLACNVTGSDEMAQHVGTFVQQSLKDGDNGKSYYGYASNDGAFVKAKNATLKPFRTMFSLPQATQVKNVMLQLGDDDSETDIIQVDADLLDGEGSPMYDLNGHIVTAPIRGQIYIQNGKKMIGK